MNSTPELKKVGSLSIVNPLVLETLEKIIRKKKKTAQISFESDLKKLYSTVTLKSVEAGEKLLNRFLNFGRSIELILDSYFPLTAERLGNQWISDKLTFAEVTIALANLQLLNAKFEPLYLSSMTSNEKDANILIIVPRGEDHTFGPISATRKLKGMKTQTMLALCYKKHELEDLVLGNEFDLIGISSGNNFMTDKINDLSTFIRTRVGKNTPIVLGGNLAKTYKQTNETLKVDLISTDPDYVLDQIGLNKRTVD